uniref:Uncharacterized protein n=1 Tax=Candidatus Kentrum sp. TC TaxID=2126339 RepID=A0A450ZRF8_9GAMM|nr:MAG: hypothetical protein BECKTC1821F_GA0114240_10103 [Candidatus Kentron sp. TC]
MIASWVYLPKGAAGDPVFGHLTMRIRQFFVVKLDNVEMIENQDSF